ncbi:hypothetical protein J2W30_006385 [Variovorax boronicumulans]|uniref:hypothetical protein n=1 Tax=Variovorax boronicumulans TaxID=436515 RepID=UPI00277E3C70|nr:hypothetical protein [Variovorax boronicumulans]MDQ0038598.1 hypothetical protein [Variovorax boronicumulans]
MQATDIQRRHASDEGRHAAWLCMLVVVGWIAGARTLAAQTMPEASQVVGAQQQAGRDRERLEILREELRKSEAQLEALERRRAERLAASDMQAAAEAEAQRIRTLADIEAIRREIASASRAAQTTAVQRVAVQAAKGTSAPSGRATPAPWWDVYGSRRRIEPSASLSLAPPLGQVPAGSSPATGASP